jgi:hypothetical protein
MAATRQTSRTYFRPLLHQVVDSRTNYPAGSDGEGNTAQFGEKTLTFHKESKRKNTEGIFGPVRGYQYEYETNSLPARSDSATLDLSAMTMENYSLAVLRLANTGQIFIMFTGVKMLAGKLQLRIIDTAILD